MKTGPNDCIVSDTFPYIYCKIILKEVAMVECKSTFVQQRQFRLLLKPSLLETDLLYVCY